MKIQSFMIRMKLPSRNEVEAQARASKYAGASLKKGVQKMIRGYIQKGGVVPVGKRCVILCEYTEATRKRDVDNVESSVKYILDALQECGIIENDNPKHVMAVPTFTEYGKEDKVNVTIFEGEDEELMELIQKSRVAYKEAFR